eukprot:310685-Pleurochrysis_carterae.AAC.7
MAVPWAAHGPLLASAVRRSQREDTVKMALGPSNAAVCATAAHGRPRHPHASPEPVSCPDTFGAKAARNARVACERRVCAPHSSAPEACRVQGRETPHAVAYSVAEKSAERASVPASMLHAHRESVERAVEALVEHLLCAPLLQLELAHHRREKREAALRRGEPTEPEKASEKGGCEEGKAPGRW